MGKFFNNIIREAGQAVGDSISGLAGGVRGASGGSDASGASGASDTSGY